MVIVIIIISSSNSFRAVRDLPKQQHQTLNETLKIIVLVDRDFLHQGDVTKHLSEEEEEEDDGSPAKTERKHHQSD